MFKDFIKNFCYTKKILGALSIGNIIEFYDFALYGFLASKLATLFFPSENPINSILGIYLVFATSFLCRPIGAIIFGYIGDIYWAYSLSFGHITIPMNSFII